MGRDDHKKPQGRHLPAQTQKEPRTDGRDVEFSQEQADHDDKKAQARSQAADKRAKRRRP